MPQGRGALRCKRLAGWVDDPQDSLPKKRMRCKSVRKVLLDPHHLGRLMTGHRATYIALNVEVAVE